MTNPTSNYSFVLPTSTDLVTDLPADFEVALQGVDTRLKALQPGTTLGDLAYSSATANTNTRLPIGSAGQVLTVVGGVPAWSSETGDIEGVTAGVGISGGGTSGTVTVTNSMATAIDAKGDLIAGTGADTFSRLAVGANDLVLTADSAQATGLKYSGAWTTWTPTYTNLTLGNGNVVARYCQIGKVVFFNFFLTFGSTTSMTAANPTFSLPVAAVRSTFFYNGNILDSGTVNYSAFAETTAGLTTATWRTQNVSATYPTTAGCEPTVPMTWTTNDNYQVSGSYEVA